MSNTSNTSNMTHSEAATSRATLGAMMDHEIPAFGRKGSVCVLALYNKTTHHIDTVELDITEMNV